MLRESNYHSRIILPGKHLSKTESDIKTILYKQKLRILILTYIAKGTSKGYTWEL